MTLFQKIFQQMLQRFTANMGRGPVSPFEWNEIQSAAVRHINKTKGVPEKSTKDPFSGWTPRVIEGGKKPKKGIADLMESEEIIFGKAPKTQKSTLDAKKDVLDRQISKEMWQKQKKAENKAAIERFKKMMEKDNVEEVYFDHPEDPRLYKPKKDKKTVEDFRDEGDWDPSGFAYGGIAPLIGEPSYAADFYDDRTPMAIGGFTKAQVLIQMIKNTLKGSKDPYVKKTFPNFIKELQKNPELALDENVWKQFTTGLPKNQRLVVHSDDTVDFFTQSEFGPHNIEKTLEFQKKHNLSREQANTILRMEPEDRVLEITRLDTIRNKTKHAEGGRVPMWMGGGLGKGKELLRNMIKYFSKGSKHGKKPSEYLNISNPKQYQKMLDDLSIYKKYHRGEGIMAPDMIKNMIKQTEGDRAGIVEHIISSARNIKKSDDSIAGYKKQMVDEMVKKGADKESAEFLADGISKAAGLKNTPKITEEGLLELETIYKNILMKEGRKLNAYGGRIGYAGGGKAGLPAITQGMPQGPNIQQPLMPAGPQPAGMPGGMIVAQNQMQQNPWMGQNPNMKQGIGGMPRAQMAGGGMGRRAFMKLLAAMSAAPFVGKGVQKAAPKMIKESAEVISKGPDGMPDYIYDLISVVQKKGTRESVPGMKRSDLGTKHTYKGVEVTEDAGGNVRIKKDVEGGGQYTDEFGEIDTWDGTVRELDMEITKGGYVKNKQGKMVKEADQYFEGTVTPDMDGKMKDVVESIDEIDHLDLKKISEEVIDEYGKVRRASGGLAYALGE